jgi:hypothetical protein
LGNLLSDGSAGSILTGGLGELVKKFQQAGQERAAQSWVETGLASLCPPASMEQALGAQAARPRLRLRGSADCNGALVRRLRTVTQRPRKPKAELRSPPAVLDTP